MTFEESIRARGFKVLKGAGKGELKINCPFCVDRGETQDTRFRLGFNTITDVGHCFNCDYSSRHIKREIISKLQLIESIIVEVDEEIEDDEVPVSLPIGFEYLKPSKNKATWYHLKALEYLKKREVPTWQIEAKRLGVTIADKYAYRVIFPVVFKKELVGFLGRDFTGQVKASYKYLNSVGKKYLYNCPSVKDIDSLVLSEGAFKAFKIERVGRVPSAALLGNSISALHLEQLKSYKKLSKILVWPDPGRPGITGACKICMTLRDEGYSTYIISPIPEKQADELSDKQVKKYLSTAVKFSDLVYSKLRTQAAFA